MKKILFIVILSSFLFTSIVTGLSERKIILKKIDQTKPENIVKALFYAAKTKNFKILKNLCDPTGKGDGDTKRICKMPKKMVKDFVLYFKKGKIWGKTLIKKNRAQVPFLFGPKGKKKETMNLVNRKGKWYLSSF